MSFVLICFSFWFVLDFRFSFFLNEKEFQKIRKRKDHKYFSGCGHCMISWVWGRKRRRLFRIWLELNLKPKLKPELKEMAQESTLSDIFYPPRTPLSSCFNFLNLGPSVTFESRALHSNDPWICLFRGCIFVFEGIWGSMFHDAFPYYIYWCGDNESNSFWFKIC